MLNRFSSVLLILIITMQAVLCIPTSAASSENTDYNNALQDGSAYAKYVTENGGISRAEKGEIAVCGNREIVLEQENKALFDFIAEEAGWYAFSFDYANTGAETAEFKMAFGIDGVTPFKNAGDITLPLFYDVGKITQNSNGDDIRPAYTVNKDYHSYSFSDSEGLYQHPYELYIEKGAHSLFITMLEGNISIKNISFYSYNGLISYEEYKRGRKEYSGKALQAIEAEEFKYTNSISVVTSSDVTSPLNTPMDVFSAKLNVLGGSNWKYAGDSVTWEIEAPQAGLYSVLFRYKQSFQEGLNSYRRLLVNGKVPYAEANAIPFCYGSDWQYSDFNCKIYLEKGKNTLTLECTVGEVAPILGAVDDLIVELNTLYRKIMMITGSSPDAYRDYNLKSEIPELKETLDKLASRAESIAEQSFNVINDKSQVYVLNDISRQLKNMSEDIRSITKSGRLKSLKSNISSLSSFSMKLREHPLLLDSLTLYGNDISLKKETFGGNLKHRLKRFAATFSEDYIKSDNNSERLTVWLNTGRDQMQVLKDLTDNDFSGKNGTEVNLQLVTGSLIHAVLAGKGPDIALDRSETDIINFAMRGAAEDISKFDGYNEVINRFSRDAMRPFSYNGGVYGLPQTQSFEMMFVRTDIFNELGLSVPKTWEEVTKNILPGLQRNNLTLGVGNLSNGGSLNCIYTLLLTQFGGSLYTKDLLSADLTSAEALDSFEFAVSLYRDYGVPQEYDFVNRFRTGEIPIALAPYFSYNQLQISAPEISGLWEMYEIPGVAGSDGTINNSQLMSSAGAILLSSSANKEDGWNFLKWLTSAEVQRSYGLQLEAVLGASGRYTTANIEAMSGLMWSKKQLSLLENQRNASQSMTNIPGSYYAGKALNSAIVVSVTKDGTISREELTRWDELIDEEIARKSKEFNYTGGNGVNSQ